MTVKKIDLEAKDSCGRTLFGMFLAPATLIFPYISAQMAGSNVIPRSSASLSPPSASPSSVWPPSVSRTLTVCRSFRARSVRGYGIFFTCSALSDDRPALRDPAARPSRSRPVFRPWCLTAHSPSHC